MHISDILKKCLMVDAKDRYQSAEELRGVLDMLNYSIVQDNRKKLKQHLVRIILFRL